jgi:hypothetical protein
MVRLLTRKAIASQNRTDGVGSRGNRLQRFRFATPPPASPSAEIQIQVPIK